jgi:hypothetical protein
LTGPGGRDDLTGRDDLNDPTSGDRNYLVDLHRRRAAPIRFANRNPTPGPPTGDGPNHPSAPDHLKSVVADRIRRNSLVVGPQNRNRHPWTRRCVRPPQKRDADQGPRIPAGAENQKECVVP